MSQGAYLAGPLVALATITAMAVMLYRSFIREQRPAADHSVADRAAAARPVGAFRPMDDYGLLVTATTCRTLDDALLITEHLRGAGIRATLVTAPDGRLRVLVFADEVMRARRLVG